MPQNLDIHTHAAARPLVFGEVLFDEFPDGHARLGGAPFHVAWHLKGFGLDPLLISRIGEDALGGIALDRLRGALLDTSGVQVDPQHPTGRATVLDADGESPRFELPADQAYDYIDRGSLPHLPHNRFAILYHGSLAVRSEASAAALQSVRDLGLPTFVDVNLRPPWWERSKLEGLIGGARWLKVSVSELDRLEDQTRGRTLLDRAQRVRERFSLEAVIVTAGIEGAFGVTSDDAITAAVERVAATTDTVGAGDAVSAVLILGIVRGWPLASTLRRAVEFASTLPSGIPDDRIAYQRFLSAWNR